MFIKRKQSIIKVNQIQDGGGNAIITSDGSGNITTQNVAANTPAFSAIITEDTTQSVTSATTTKIQLDKELIENYLDGNQY